MRLFTYHRPYRWRTALQALAILAALSVSFSVRASITCDIPDPTSTDKPYDASQVSDSFFDSSCTPQFLTSDTLFYRYYSFPAAPSTNIGRFFTTNIYQLNSEAIVGLALYPFPPNPQFQNFAYYREQVLVLAGTQLYVGTAGPQPPTVAGSCYAGGAAQYFFAGDNISNNSSITFSSPQAITKDTRYPNQFGVGDPCNVIPEPGTLLLFGIGAAVLLMRVNGVRRNS